MSTDASRRGQALLNILHLDWGYIDATDAENLRRVAFRLDQMDEIAGITPGPYGTTQDILRRIATDLETS